MPGKIQRGHIPGKIHSILMSPSHNLMGSVLGTRDVNMNHTSFLSSSGASPELEIILMLNVSLMDRLNNEKH